MSTHHVKVAIGVTVIVAAVAYLLLSGTTTSTMYFLTVPEVQHQLSALQQASRPIRVAGQVTADPIHWDAGQLALAFRIGEGEAHLIGPVNGAYDTVAVSAGGRLVATGGRLDGKVRLWDGTGGRELATLGTHPQPVRGLSFGPDGRLLASSGLDRPITLGDVSGRRELRRLSG